MAGDVAISMDQTHGASFLVDVDVPAAAIFQEGIARGVILAVGFDGETDADILAVAVLDRSREPPLLLAQHTQRSTMWINASDGDPIPENRPSLGVAKPFYMTVRYDAINASNPLSLLIGMNGRAAGQLLVGFEDSNPHIARPPVEELRNRLTTAQAAEAQPQGRFQAAHYALMANGGPFGYSRSESMAGNVVRSATEIPGAIPSLGEIEVGVSSTIEAGLAFFQATYYASGGPVVASLNGSIRGSTLEDSSTSSPLGSDGWAHSGIVQGEGAVDFSLTTTRAERDVEMAALILLDFETSLSPPSRYVPDEVDNQGS